MKKFLAILVLLGIGGASWAYVQRQRKLLANYKKQVVGVQVLKVSLDEIIMNFTMRFTNTSDIEATITKLYTDVYINNVYVGYTSSTDQALIPAQGNADIKFQINFSPQLILKNILNIVLSSASITQMPYRLKGYARIKSGFIPLSLPFEYAGTLNDLI